MYSVAELDDALSRLPGIYLSLARLQERIKRCKPGSKRYLDYDHRCIVLGNEGSDLSAKLRLLIHHPEIARTTQIEKP